MIEVLRPGQYTTIQDLGRFGYRSVGVPVSGPMDSESARFANDLLGNDPNCPLIEMAYVGATFRFHQAAIISISGASCEVKLNEALVQEKAVIQIESGSVLSFGAMTNGNFLYLAVCGGFQVEKMLGSACYFEAVNGIARMKKGTILPFDETLQNRPTSSDQPRVLFNGSASTIEVEKGPEFHLLSEQETASLSTINFSISRQSNRMGYRLNELVNFDIQEIISSPVQPGTIQLTQGGQLIVLMRDAQTTGGYARILQLTEKSINHLAQTPSETSFSFSILDD